MSEVTSGKSVELRRPISPHLQIYNIFSKEMTSGLSFLNRFTRCAFSFISIYILFWLVAAFYGEYTYDLFLRFITSWFGWFSLIGFSACYFYYLVNGARYLIFDVGYWVDKKSVFITGVIAIILSVGLFIGTWGYVICRYLQS